MKRQLTILLTVFSLAMSAQQTSYDYSFKSKPDDYKLNLLAGGTFFTLTAIMVVSDSKQEYNDNRNPAAYGTAVASMLCLYKAWKIDGNNYSRKKKIIDP